MADLPVPLYRIVGGERCNPFSVRDVDSFSMVQLYYGPAERCPLSGEYSFPRGTEHLFLLTLYFQTFVGGWKCELEYIYPILGSEFPPYLEEKINVLAKDFVRSYFVAHTFNARNSDYQVKQNSLTITFKMNSSTVDLEMNNIMKTLNLPEDLRTWITTAVNQ